MKITKSTLKQIIKEELEHLEEYESMADEVIKITLGVSSKGNDKHYDTKVEYNGKPAAPMHPEYQEKFEQALKNLKEAAHQLAYYCDRPKRS